MNISQITNLVNSCNDNKYKQIRVVRCERYGNSIIGYLIITGKISKAFFTLENAEKKIPTGIYKLEFTYSPKFSPKAIYKDFRVVPLIDVPHREGIRIHIGNTDKDTTGCILVGNKLVALEDKPMLSFSGNAYTEMMDILKYWKNENLEISVIDLKECL